MTKTDLKGPDMSFKIREISGRVDSRLIDPKMGIDNMRVTDEALRKISATNVYFYGKNQAMHEAGENLTVLSLDTFQQRKQPDYFSGRGLKEIAALIRRPKSIVDYAEEIATNAGIFASWAHPMLNPIQQTIVSAVFVSMEGGLRRAFLASRFETDLSAESRNLSRETSDLSTRIYAVLDRDTDIRALTQRIELRWFGNEIFENERTREVLAQLIEYIKSTKAQEEISILEIGPGNILEVAYAIADLGYTCDLFDTNQETTAIRIKTVKRNSTIDLGRINLLTDPPSKKYDLIILNHPFISGPLDKSLLRFLNIGGYIAMQTDFNQSTGEYIDIVDHPELETAFKTPKGDDRSYVFPSRYTGPLDTFIILKRTGLAKALTKAVSNFSTDIMNLPEWQTQWLERRIPITDEKANTFLDELKFVIEGLVSSLIEGEEPQNADLDDLLEILHLFMSSPQIRIAFFEHYPTFFNTHYETLKSHRERLKFRSPLIEKQYLSIEMAILELFSDIRLERPKQK